MSSRPGTTGATTTVVTSAEHATGAAGASGTTPERPVIATARGLVKTYGRGEATVRALDGVDVLFVGPRDLSHDLGVPGDLHAPAYTRALERVRAAAAQHGKACGLLVPSGAAAAGRRAEGWTFIAIGSAIDVNGGDDNDTEADDPLLAGFEPERFSRRAVNAELRREFAQPRAKG